MAEYLRVGKIVKTHGVDGEVFVYPLTDDASRFSLLSEIFIEESGSPIKIGIEYSRINGNKVVLKLKNVSDINSAEKILNKYILIKRADAVKLPENSFFISDLIGCEVSDENCTLLGELTDVLQTGGNDVYTVTDKAGREILIPALKSVFIEMDIEHKKIKVRLPEGLV